MTTYIIVGSRFASPPVTPLLSSLLNLANNASSISSLPCRQFAMEKRWLSTFLPSSTLLLYKLCAEGEAHPYVRDRYIYLQKHLQRFCCSHVHTLFCMGVGKRAYMCIRDRHVCCSHCVTQYQKFEG